MRFAETEYKLVAGIPNSFEYYTEINNVSILRLKFRTGVKIYDLGTISNKITGSNTDPDNNNTNELDLLGGLKDLGDKLGIPVWLIILFIVIIFLVILLPVLGLIFPVVGQALKVVFKAIGKLIKWLFNALVWIISLPIKVIVWIVNKCKGGGTA